MIATHHWPDPSEQVQSVASVVKRYKIARKGNDELE